MATMLRYIRYFRRTGRIARRLNISCDQVESNVTRLRFLSYQHKTLTKNFSMNLGVQNAIPTYGFERTFQDLEMQLKRSGRTNKADIEKTLEEVQLAGSIQSVDALLLIRCCGKPLIDETSADSIKLVQEIWGALEALRIQLDISHYNALLGVYLEKDYDFSQATFLATILEKGIQPNRVTYNRLIEAYCRKGDIMNAMKVLEMMKEKNLPLCENVFNSLIRGHSEAGDIKNAEGVLDTMKNAGMEPSIDTYNSLLCAYAKHGDMDSIKNTLEKLATLGLPLSDEHMIDIIEVLVGNGYVNEAEEFSTKLSPIIISDSLVSKLLVKLVELNQVKLAMTILKNTATEPARFQVRSGFILKMAIKSKALTVEDIIALCTQIQEEGLHPRSWSFILHQLLNKAPDSDLVVTLMKAWRERGGEIREHFFRPILRAHVRKGNYQGILDTLGVMVEDFKIMPSLTTLSDYTIPFMFGTWDGILDKLEKLQIPKELILHAIAMRAVIDRKLRNCLMFMQSYPIIYPKDQLLQALTLSLNTYDDTKSFVSVLRFLGNESGEANVDEVSIEIVDEAVLMLLSTIMPHKSSVVEKFLYDLVESGSSISPEVGEKVKEYFETDKARELSEVITKLTSRELKPLPLGEFYPQLMERRPEYTKRPVDVNIGELRAVFADHIARKDEKGIRKFLDQLLSYDYPAHAVLAQALDLFCTADNIEDADYCYNEFMKRCSNMALTGSKILSYAILLIKHDRYADAIKIITDSAVLEDSEKLSRGLKGKAKLLLDAIADTENVDNVNQMFELLVSKNYIVYDGFSLSSLVRVHVLKNDMKEAVALFERFYVEHQCMPYKHNLFKRLIELEEADLLQKVTDLCIECHGENNALVDLAIQFVEAGRPHQARKILETNGMQIFNGKITNVIRHFKELDKMDCLEQLPKITKGVIRMDSTHLFQSLLDVYNECNDWERGLALWTEMQEMDITPTNYFLNTLKHLLQKNEQPVPFITEPMTDAEKRGARNRMKNFEIGRERPRINTERSSLELEAAIATKDWSGALNIIQSNSLNRENIKSAYEKLILALLKDNNLETAVDLFKSILRDYGGLWRRTFFAIGDELLKEKRYDLLENLGLDMNEKTKKALKYYKLLSRSQIEQIGLHKYLQQFNGKSPSAEEGINFSALVNGLLADPSCVEEFEEWTKQFQGGTFDRVMQVLWNYHFIKANPKADELWNEYISKSYSPLVRPIIEFATANNDPILLKRLLTQVDKHGSTVEHNSGINTKCKIISRLIHVYNTMKQYDEGLDILREATKNYRLELFTFSVLQDLKKGLEENGKKFPFTLTLPNGMENEEYDNSRQAAFTV